MAGEGFAPLPLPGAGILDRLKRLKGKLIRSSGVNKVKDGMSLEHTLCWKQSPCRTGWAEHRFRLSQAFWHAFQRPKLGSALRSQKPCASGIDRQVRERLCPWGVQLASEHMAPWPGLPHQIRHRRSPLPLPRLPLLLFLPPLRFRQLFYPLLPSSSAARLGSYANH